ncbi:hypothetical protein C1646_777457 [Rhizophagus diaphanus]|nr:hypothetical protein C1646_777457 [Rhizophagus diaphanus] [Rhizophagus sp. MUCL 43196]
MKDDAELHRGVKKVMETMTSELELSKQHITELEAENVNLRRKFSMSNAEIAELKRRNNEFLRANKEYNERRDAENAKLKARIEELESEFGDRITKVEQKQTLQKKDMYSFLLEAHKKFTGDNISAPSSIENNLIYDSKQMITCTDSEDAPSDEMSGPIAIQPLDRNQVTEQTLKHELSKPISLVASVELHDESILNNAIEGSMQRLAYWIDEAIKMGLKEILCLYYYSFEFEEKVKILQLMSHVSSKTDTIGNDLTSVTPQASVSPVSIPGINLTYDRSYFRNKTLDQYPDLYREFSSKNFDYYGITDETSCPLCKLDHNDEESIEDTSKDDLIIFLEI